MRIFQVYTGPNWTNIIILQRSYGGEGVSDVSDLKVNTISEAEEKTGVKARKIHYLIKTGKIQAEKLGWV